MPTKGEPLRSTFRDRRSILLLLLLGPTRNENNRQAHSPECSFRNRTMSDLPGLTSNLSEGDVEFSWSAAQPPLDGIRGNPRICPLAVARSIVSHGVVLESGLTAQATCIAWQATDPQSFFTGILNRSSLSVLNLLHTN